VREILRIAKLPLSLEKPLGEENDSKLGDFVEDELAQSPFDLASLSLRRADIGRALSALPERERRVIELRFGLDGGQPRTLDQVGRAFGVTANGYDRSKTPRSTPSPRYQKPSA